MVPVSNFFYFLRSLRCAHFAHFAALRVAPSIVPCCARSALPHSRILPHTPAYLHSHTTHSTFSPLALNPQLAALSPSYFYFFQTLKQKLKSLHLIFIIFSKKTRLYSHFAALTSLRSLRCAHFAALRVAQYFAQLFLQRPFGGPGVNTDQKYCANNNTTLHYPCVNTTKNTTKSCKIL